MMYQMSDSQRQDCNAIGLSLPLFNSLKERFIKLHQIESSVNCEIPQLLKIIIPLIPEKKQTTVSLPVISLDVSHVVRTLKPFLLTFCNASSNWVM